MCINSCNFFACAFMCGSRSFFCSVFVLSLIIFFDESFFDESFFDEARVRAVILG